MSALSRHDRKILRQGSWLVGIDEAGRGALAGPVVAGACVLGRAFFEDRSWVRRSARINDSKQLTAEDRAAQFELLMELREAGALDFEVASGSVGEIAEHNISGATRLAMRRAVERLAGRAKEGWTLPNAAADGPLFAGTRSVRVLVDGRPLRPFPYAHDGLVGGDGRSLAIAMASIAAKVTRDRQMEAHASTHPGYGFERHKGYGTATHRSAIERLGPSPLHRALFLRKILAHAPGA